MLKLMKREELTKGEGNIIRISSILLSFLIVALFLGLFGFNPIDIYGGIIKGSFGSSYAVIETLIKAIPLVITALGISVAFKMKFWNIGGEGQILIGALCATYIGLNFSNIPKPILLFIMALASIVGGGLWALISSVLRERFNTNETIVTLMLNYIAIKIIVFLQHGPWKDPAAMGFPKIKNFSPNATLPSIFSLHIGFIIAIVLVILVHIFLKHSKLGYEVSVIGESTNTALYAGINIKKSIYVAIFISGALCGITGFIQASAVSRTLSVEVAGGVGFTAIIIAWLSDLKPWVTVVTSIAFAALLQGAVYIQTAFGIPLATAQLIQATILFFVLGSEFFIKYKIKLLKSELKNVRINATTDEGVN
jgi:general nucleoside transport system permease protein